MKQHAQLPVGDETRIYKNSFFQVMQEKQAAPHSSLTGMSWRRFTFIVRRAEKGTKVEEAFFLVDSVQVYVPEMRIRQWSFELLQGPSARKKRKRGEYAQAGEGKPQPCARVQELPTGKASLGV